MDDAALDGTPSRNELSGSAGNVVQAHSIGSVTFAAPEPPPVVPSQVPPPPGVFTDREEQITLLRGLAAASPGRTRPAVAAVRGMHGVGKTALLRQLAATTRDLFPDGALHVAFGQRGEAPSEAAARLLLGLGVPERRIPATFEQRVDLYRSMSAGARLLVVLDDVADAAQVTALLPNSPASMVLVAGNRALEELYVDGAVDVALRPLPTADGVRLLAGICGGARVDADQGAAAELVDAYEGLPLAIRVAGARLASRPKWTVRRLVEELRDAAAGASQVDARLFAMFDVVHADLAEPLRGLYRALGVLGGVRFVHFGPEVLAAMTGRPVGAVRAELDELCQAGLVEEDGEDTYRLHRMVRRHAAHRAAEEDADDDRRESLRRAVRWWLFGAMTADVAIDPGRLRVADPDGLAVGDAVPAAAALDWLDREHANLLAVLRAAAGAGWHAEVCRLFEALFALYKARKPLSAWVRAGETAVDSAVLTGSADTEARCRCLLAKAYQELERFDDAHAQLDRARSMVDPGSRIAASVHDFTGNVHMRQGDYETALACFTSALETNRRLGLNRGTALQSMLVGRALGRLGRFDEALAMLDTARDLVGPDTPLLPKILASTGAVLAAAGSTSAAEEVLRSAIDLADAHGNTADATDALITLADHADARGDAALAAGSRARAARLLERMGSPRAARLLAGLGINEGGSSPRCRP